MLNVNTNKVCIITLMESISIVMIFLSFQIEIKIIDLEPQFTITITIETHLYVTEGVVLIIDIE